MRSIFFLDFRVKVRTGGLALNLGGGSGRLLGYWGWDLGLGWGHCAWLGGAWGDGRITSAQRRVWRGRGLGLRSGGLGLCGGDLCWRGWDLEQRCHLQQIDFQMQPFVVTASVIDVTLVVEIQCLDQEGQGTALGLSDISLAELFADLKQRGGRLVFAH